MAPKRRRYEARFSANRIKKIMQKDEEVGKVSAAVPVMISRVLELFLEGLLKRSQTITASHDARTLSAQHLQECVNKFDEYGFLRPFMAASTSRATAAAAEAEEESETAADVSKETTSSVNTDNDNPVNASSPSKKRATISKVTNGKVRRHSLSSPNSSKHSAAGTSRSNSIPSTSKIRKNRDTVIKRNPLCVSSGDSGMNSEIVKDDND